ncbi:hypothetical protein ACB098_05G155100 [Castanea mollissima]
MSFASLHELRAFGTIHKKWTLPVNVAAVPHLTFPKTDRMALLRLIGVGGSTDLLQSLESRRGLLQAVFGFGFCVLMSHGDEEEAGFAGFLLSSFVVWLGLSGIWG